MKNFQKQIQKQFDKMCTSGKLFRSNISTDKVWEVYLSSFREEDNPIFRDPESSTHNCNLCKNFIRRYGNILSIDENYNIISLFDIEETEKKYSNSCKNLSKLLRNSSIENVFFETYQMLNDLPYEKCNKGNAVFQLGVDRNTKRYTKEEAEKFGVVKTNDIVTFNHLYLHLPACFVDTLDKSIEEITGNYRDAKNVFKRAMDEIPSDTLTLVVDLINQGSLLDGQTHLHKLTSILELKKKYDSLSSENKIKDNWCWVHSYKYQFSKFRNELIGTLCVELAEGSELNEACKNWNKRVDPVNYMKASAPITKKQIEEAKKFVEENGYEDSFNRRCATIEDIKASEILHLNIGKEEIKKVSIFDDIKSTSTRHKRSEFDKIEEVTIDKFMKDILPSCTSIEAFLLDSHAKNMVTLTTANVKESKPIFKWSNNYSWTFNGNIAGVTQIKEAVKVAGGKIDGVLRASMIWNESGKDNSDLDLWCEQPNHETIGFSTQFRKDKGSLLSSCSGCLDLDNINPRDKIGVENIYFANLNKMKDGTYLFWVNQYAARNSQGFKFEIEFDGQMFQYEYNKPVQGNINIAKVTLDNKKFTIEHLLPLSGGSNISQEIYGLETNMFHKVNLLCLSPNHWNENNIGNKHYFFMLDKCKAPAKIRSFHNENLIGDLLQHRKVMEVLGNSAMIESTDKQLSGLGFNATVSDSVVLKLSGSHKRTIRVNF